MLTLVYFYYLDKNPGWVIDGYGNDDFSEDGASARDFSFILPLHLCEDYVLLFMM